MAKVVATVKAVVTRLVFAAHGLLAIWQVTIFKRDSHFWYLSAPVLLLFFEGVFTLTIKANQEWKWFCPSVFLYLGSVVPAIWLLELDKLDKRQRAREGLSTNATSAEGLRELDQLLGPHVQLSALSISADTWLTLIEQFLMLILILGRWMLPKGDLTRDQLSQLLLVYIGTAADIIEFFDAFQDETIGQHPVLTALTLAIWSWSLLQFTVVLTATKSSRRSRLSAPSQPAAKARGGGSQKGGVYCCSIDVWAILINILLQDAPFVTFRLLLICYYRIISYMNVFFTCKNTLVIALQLYRLYAVYAEKNVGAKKNKGKLKRRSTRESPDISLVLAALESGTSQYYSDLEAGGLPSRRAKKGGAAGRAGGRRVGGAASCSELGGANPASNLRLLLAPDDEPHTAGHRVRSATNMQQSSITNHFSQCRRKSVSVDNLHGGALSEADGADEADEAQAEGSSDEAEEEDEGTPHDDDSSPEEDLLADLSPAQLNLLRAAASKSTVAPRGVRQDTGYSTASSSHGSVRDSRCTSSISAATSHRPVVTAGRRGEKVTKARSTRSSSRGGCSGRVRVTAGRPAGRQARHLQLLQGDERV